VSKQRKFFRDVCVTHMADCWTDQTLRAKVGLQVIKSKSQGFGRYRFASYKLCDSGVHATYNGRVIERITPLPVGQRYVIYW